MTFSEDKYDYGSIYYLNNGGYIIFETKGPFYTAVAKDPNGNIVQKGNESFTTPANLMIEEILGFLNSSTPIPTIEVTQITPRIPPTPVTSTDNLRIIGKIIDKETGDPISNAKIEPILVNKSPTRNLSTFNPGYTEETEENFTGGNVLSSAPVLDPSFTNENGEFIIDYASDSPIDFNRSSINVSKTQYFSKSIKNLQLTSKIKLSPSEFKIKNKLDPTDDVNVDLYELGIILLSPSVADTKKPELEVRSQLKERENLVVKNITKSQLPFESRMSLLFETQKEKIKQNFIPVVLGIIATFGPNVLQGIINNKVNAINDKECPSKDEILKALKKRNKLVKELNNLYKIVRRIAKVSSTAESIILGVRIALTASQFTFNIPPAKFGYGPLVEKGFKTAEDFLRKAGIAVNAINLAAATIGLTLGFLLDLLKSADELIQSCAEGEDIPFTELNKEFANFLDEATEENQNVGILDPLTNKPYPYKGFTFEIKDDTSQSFKYPKRYAIARNNQGIQMLKGNSSFASSPEILIEELKFIIDRDNLRAD